MIHIDRMAWGITAPRWDDVDADVYWPGWYQFGYTRMRVPPGFLAVRRHQDCSHRRLFIADKCYCVVEQTSRANQAVGTGYVVGKSWHIGEWCWDYARPLGSYDLERNAAVRAEQSARIGLGAR